MNKLRVFLGIVFSIVTILSVSSIIGILYGMIDPTYPAMLGIFLTVLSIFTGAAAVGCLFKYVEADYV